MERLYEQLQAALGRHGLNRRYEIALSALSLRCHSVLHKGAQDMDEVLGTSNPHLTGTMALAVLSDGFPPVVEQLCNWAEAATDAEQQAYQDCLVICRDADVEGMSQTEDLLGFIYTMFQHKADRSGNAFFTTPLAVGRLAARITLTRKPPYPGYSVSDPTCGTGGLFIAYSMEAKAMGFPPFLIRYYGQDIDAMALSLCVVNLIYREMLIPGLHLDIGKSLLS